jgi:hypothetical protein
MATYGVTGSGFVPEPLAQIEADLQAALQAQFGADIDLSASGPPRPSTTHPGTLMPVRNVKIDAPKGGLNGD